VLTILVLPAAYALFFRLARQNPARRAAPCGFEVGAVGAE
jgi:hypothetical protein